MLHHRLPVLFLLWYLVRSVIYRATVADQDIPSKKSRTARNLKADNILSVHVLLIVTSRGKETWLAHFQRF